MFNGVELFKKLSFGKKIRLSIIALIVGIMVLAPLVAAAGNPNPGVLPLNSNAYGKTYGEWSAEWWRWSLSIPKPINPVLDETGEFCAKGQSGKVWFLAGTVGKTEVKRQCEIPAGKAIFFPIFNVEGSKIEGMGENEADFRNYNNDIMIHVTEIKVSIDGKPLQNLKDYRTDSGLFEFTLPVDNVLGLSAGSSPAVSDGYWIMLAPLSAGKHTIYIYGKAKDVLPPEYGSDFETEVTYDINVKPKRW